MLSRAGRLDRVRKEKVREKDTAPLMTAYEVRANCELAFSLSLLTGFAVPGFMGLCLHTLVSDISHRLQAALEKLSDHFSRRGA